MSLIIILFQNKTPDPSLLKKTLDIPETQRCLIIGSSALIDTDHSSHILLKKLKKAFEDEFTVIPWASNNWAKSWDSPEAEEWLNQTMSNDSGPRQVIMS